MQKYIKNISNYFVIEEEDVYLSASIGIAMAPTDGEDEKSFSESGCCFGKSKGKGKRALSFYCNGLDCEREQRFIIENQLYRAIEKMNFSYIISRKLILRRKNS